MKYESESRVDGWTQEKGTHRSVVFGLLYPLSTLHKSVATVFFLFLLLYGTGTYTCLWRVKLWVINTLGDQFQE